MLHILLKFNAIYLKEDLADVNMEGCKYLN